MFYLLKIIDFFLHSQAKNNPQKPPHMQRAYISILMIGSLACFISAINAFNEIHNLSTHLFTFSFIGLLGLFLFKVIRNDKIALRIMLCFYVFVDIYTANNLASVLNSTLVWGTVITATSVLVGGYLFGLAIAIVYLSYFTFLYFNHNPQITELLYSPERLNVIYFDLSASLIVAFAICVVSRLALTKVEKDLTSLQAQEFHSNSKMQFLTNMSHEFRTPMNGILGVTELLSEDATEDQIKNLKLIKKSASSLLRTLSEILDISRAEHNLLDLSYDLFDPNKVIKECIDIMEIAAVEKGLSIEFLSKSPEVSIKGDELRLKQILLNLLGNAIKFTDKGKISLSCDTIYKDKRNLTLEFTVEDSGVGIHDHDKAYIFDYLTNKDYARNKFSGSGLGLVVCQKLIHAQNGKITFESQIHKGSKFIFSLPYTIG